MGLDQYLTLVKYFYHGGRDGEPTMVDGWRLTEQRMEVLDWRKHIWVHQFFCERHAYANDCRDVQISASELELLADKLEQWSDDPDVLPPIDDKFRGPFFGTHPSHEDYKECRDFYCATAKDEAKQIRLAIKWLKGSSRSKKAPANVYRSVIYHVSW